jgi:type II secretory pathway component PulF
MICVGLSLIILVLIVVAAAVVPQRHAMRRLGLLWVLRTAVKRSVPLAPALEAFAAESSGYAGFQARSLATLLRAGASLPDALEQVWGYADPELLPAIRVGYQAGALDAALEQAATTSPEQETILQQTIGWVTLYCGIVPFFGLSILTFVMLKIVPAFQRIFQDFSTSLPPMTQGLIAASHSLTSGLWILVLPLLLLLCAWSVFAVLRFIGVPVDLPLLGRFTRRLHTSRILDAMALSVGKGRPVAESVGVLAAVYPRAWARRRLRRVFRDVESGQDWCASLRGNGMLGPSDLAVVLAARRVGNLGWALSEIAEAQRRRTYRRIFGWGQVAMPVFVLGIGAIVASIVIGLFLPLIALIQKLA